MVEFAFAFVAIDVRLIGPIDAIIDLVAAADTVPEVELAEFDSSPFVVPLEFTETVPRHKLGRSAPNKTPKNTLSRSMPVAFRLRGSIDSDQLPVLRGPSWEEKQENPQS
jgi:hypothetical protein